MKSFLAIDTSLCTGCRNCELACSVKHTGTFNPSRGRIEILKDENQGLIIPMVCLQCESPLCEEACPTGALHRNDEDVLTVNSDVCIGCLNCVTACIYGGIAMDPTTRKVVKCDLCNGAPACVPACDYKAIKMVPTGAEALTQRLQGMQKLSAGLGLIKEES
jgi:Fe-S-cluster-containing hydrogenase component 2